MSRKEWRKEIRKAKADMWKEWVEERKDVWAIGRVARNTVGLTQRENTIAEQGVQRRGPDGGVR